MMNTASAGGAQAKTGIWACALDRHSGFVKTEKAMVVPRVRFEAQYPPLPFCIWHPPFRHF